MEQKLELQPITLINQDLSSSPLIRFYLQEEAFSFQSNTTELPFNQLVTEVVTEAILASKFLCMNSRLNTNFLQNGRDIYSRKKQHFSQFLAEYKLIAEALVYLPPHLQDIVKYTICALSNLILKLSINMAKISIIFITRLLTPRYLNIFTAAILFEKFMGRQLLVSKEGNRSPDQQRILVKQFPKYTIIKLSKTRNSFDFYLINKCQNSFSKEAYNMQLIELFEQEEELKQEFTPAQLKRRQKFNLQKQFGIKAPYGMELYLLFSEVIAERMIEFKPDIVILIEDYDGAQPGVEPDVKGLIINEISSKVQNKIYILKQFGPTQEMKRLLLSQHNLRPVPQVPEQLDAQLQASFKDEYSNTISALINSYQRWPDHRQRAFAIKSLIQQNISAHQQIENDFVQRRLQQFRKKKAAVSKKSFEPPQGQSTGMIQQMRKNLFDDVANISLSLIQKSNYEAAIRKFRNFHFPPKFISQLISWMRVEKAKVDGNCKIFSDVSERLRNKIAKLNTVREISLNCKSNEGNYSNQPFSFYNLQLGIIEIPILEDSNSVSNHLPIKYQDPIYIHYSEQSVLIFHCGPERLTIYRRRYSSQSYQRLREQSYEGSTYLSAKASTLISNKKYFYKAFGQFSGEQANRSIICRINILQEEAITHQKWQVLQQCIVIADKKSAKIPLELKQLGWAESIDVQSDNWVLFGGGYNFAVSNEERVNKFLYLIKNDGLQILKVGKASSQILNEVENIKQKQCIYSFVYGVPLFHNDSELVVLNTNGYVEHISNSKSFYLTKYRLLFKSSRFPLLTVVSQNKMLYQLAPEEVIVNKNMLLSHVHRGYHLVNRHQGINCLNDDNNEPLQLKVNLDSDTDEVTLSSPNNFNKGETDSSFSLFFAGKKLILREEKKKTE